MKKLFATVSGLVLLLALAVPVHSQNASLGVKVGTNLATLKGADAGSPKTLAGLIGGVFLTVGSDVVAFQPELLYAQKGAKDNDANTTMKLRLDYFEVPLLVRLAPRMEQSKFVPHVMLGPSIAFRSTCKVSGEESGASVSFNCDDPQLDMPVKTVDYGMIFGAGADVELSRVALVLDAHYDLGLAKIDDSTAKSDVKNRGFAIMAGVKFPLGKGTRVAAR